MIKRWPSYKEASMYPKSRFSPEVHQILLESGWYEGRSVSEMAGELSHPGQRVHAEFGGLRVGRSGSGRECAACDVDFRRLLAEVPTERRFDKVAQPVLVYPVAEVCNGHATLWLDQDGIAYFEFDQFERFAGTFERSLERLLL